jgi:ABC-2 type transport system ATP-binding protein
MMAAAMADLVPFLDPERRASGAKEIVARTRGLTKKYGETPALREVNIELCAGELLALLGPNGAGKTTLVRTLLGLAKADAGSVSVFGAPPTTLGVRMRCGAMLQVARVPETLKVREHVALFSSYYPKPLAVDETLQVAGIEDIRDRRFGELSGGQKQRVMFALAICGDPDLLFLDEPTVGMDVEARRLMWSQIRLLIARGKTVLLTTHYLHEADALADRILVLQQGSIIAEGTPAEIKARAAGKQIRCATRLSRDEIAAIPGVHAIREDRHAYEIQVGVAEPVLRELLRRDEWLCDLEVTNAGLEEAFLALTKGSG